MGKTTSIGHLLINDLLPEDMRRDDFILDKKGVEKLFAEVQAKYPDKYNEIVTKVNRLGGYLAEAAGHSVSLSSMQKPPEVRVFINNLKKQINLITDDDRLTDDQKNTKILELMGENNPVITKMIFDLTKQKDNPLAIQAMSGSRGNENQLRQIIGGDGLVVDNNDNIIPSPILNGYAEGLSPLEYFAASYGARSGTVCLHEDTLVRMADGSTKAIKDIQIGDYVLGSDNFGNGKAVKVINNYNNGLMPCYRYTFSDRSTVICTDEHKFLCEIDSKHVEQVKPRDWFGINGNKKHTVKQLYVQGFNRDGVDEPRALLAGLMLGDGCMAPSCSKQYSFSCADPLLISDIEEYLNGFDIELYKAKGGNYTYTLNGGRNNPTKLWLCSTLGEKLAHDKALPDMSTWSVKSIAALIGGLFSTDGSVYTTKRKTRISYASTSFTLIKQLKDVLAVTFGIYTGGIFVQPVEVRDNATHDLYSITIAKPVCVDRFYQQIPLVGKKRITIEAAYKRKDKSPFVGTRLLDFELLGQLPTRDLEVDSPEHLFALANNLIVSNSTKFCLHADTLVKLPEGKLKRISEIKPGDTVYGSDKQGNTSFVKVKNVFNNGHRHCFDVSMHNGRHSFNVVCTAEHKFLTYTLYPTKAFSIKALKDINIKKDRIVTANYLSTTVKPFKTLNNRISVLLNYFLGLYCSGLNLPNKLGDAIGKFKFAPARQTELDYLINVCNEHGIKYKLKQNDSTESDTDTLVATSTVIELFDNNFGIADYIKKCGVWRNELRAPNNLQTMTNLEFAAFLQGYFARSAGLNKSNTQNTWLYVQCTDRQVLESFKTELDRRFGITPHIHNIKNIPKKSKQPLSCLVIASMNLAKLDDIIELPNKFKEHVAPLKCLTTASNFAIIDNIKDITTTQPTFDIEVDHPDHLFVLDNHVVTSNSTQEAGFFGKQLAQAAHRYVVTEDDCATTNGIPTEANDSDNLGSVLSNDVDGYKAGTVVTPEIQRKLGDKKIYVRSAITCSAHEGICAKCAGIRSKGRFPKIGENIGLPAAQSLSEKMTQGMLCLHEDTLVAMADSSFKAIKDIVIGDYVSGCTVSGEFTPTQVKNVFNNGSRDCYEYIFERKPGRKQIKIIATKDHKILGVAKDKPDTSAPAKYCLGDGNYTAIIPSGVEGIFVTLKLVSVKYLGSCNTFDIEVDHPDHLFVLDNGLVVSNSAKHTGGQAGAGGTRSGFNYVNQLIQVPTNFAGAATLSKLDGRVTKIEAAPQGGQFVYVDNEKHYVPADQDVTVRSGDVLEAGDSMSNGVPNPAEIVSYKGLGAGRLYFTKALYEGFKNSNIKPNRRNVEVLARGLVNHVKITDPDGYAGFLVDDVVPYDEFRRHYEPREDSEDLTLDRARNNYLETDVNQFTIGTRLTPSVLNELKLNGIKSVKANKNPPPFEPQMIRAMESATHDTDWRTRMYGSYLSKGLADSVRRGRESVTPSTSYIPSLTEGKNFGKSLFETGKY